MRQLLSLLTAIGDQMSAGVPFWISSHRRFLDAKTISRKCLFGFDAPIFYHLRFHHLDASIVSPESTTFCAVFEASPRLNYPRFPIVVHVVTVKISAKPKNVVQWLLMIRNGVFFPVVVVHGAAVVQSRRPKRRSCAPNGEETSLGEDYCSYQKDHDLVPTHF